MTWNELSDSLSFKRVKKVGKVVARFKITCKSCIEMSQKRGHLCKPCRDKGLTYDDYKVKVEE